jgi:predicted transcriptional regulator
MSEKDPKPTVRASVSFSNDQYADLERIAANKKVSVAWVVRDAIDQYLAAQYPLLNAQDRRG